MPASFLSDYASERRGLEPREHLKYSWAFLDFDAVFCTNPRVIERGKSGTPGTL
jgi:hypothetical protein